MPVARKGKINVLRMSWSRELDHNKIMTHVNSGHCYGNCIYMFYFLRGITLG